MTTPHLTPVLRKRRRSSIDFTNETMMTQQSQKEESDIHNILKKHAATGLLSHVNKYKGEYADMSSAPEFQEAQNIIAEAKSVFETVPAKLRAKFHNNPDEFLDFMQNPANRDKIEDMGFDASHLPQEQKQNETPRTTNNASKAPDGAPKEAQTTEE